MSFQRRIVRCLLAAALATGLSACSGGLRTEPTTSTLPVGAVAPTLPGATEDTSTTTTVLGGTGSSSTLGGGRTTTTRRAGGTTSTTGG